MSDPCFLSIGEVAARRAAGTLTARDLVERHLARIARLDGAINAYVKRLSEEARAAAAASDARGRRLGPLDGVPLAVKDLIDIAGAPTTSGLGLGDPPPASTDAEVVRRLREAGAVILGKVNLHEAALGTTTDNPFFGRTGNPHRLDHTPGGSSGGSAAAVAAGLAVAALGTDTMGSVRIPAAYCGIVGLKPTYGLVSTRGVQALSRRLDHVGVLARSVDDAALMLDAIAGFDPACPDSREAPPAHGAGRETVAGLRIGVARDFAAVTVESAVERAFAAALDTLRGLGCGIETVDLGGYDPGKGRRAGLLEIEAEAALLHAERLRNAPSAFSPQLRALLDYGAKARAPQLVQALHRIEDAAFMLRRLLRAVDVLVTPTAPQAAFPFAATVPSNQADFVAIANFAGCPAISVPMGRDDSGLPLGLQIIAAPFAEPRLIALARAFEGTAGGAILPPPPYGPD